MATQVISILSDDDDDEDEERALSARPSSSGIGHKAPPGDGHLNQGKRQQGLRAMTTSTTSSSASASGKRKRGEVIEKLKFTTLDAVAASLGCTRISTPANNYSCMTYALSIALGMINTTPTADDHAFVDRLRKYAICTMAMRMHTFNNFPDEWTPEHGIPLSWHEEFGDVLVKQDTQRQYFMFPKKLLLQLQNSHGTEGFWITQLQHYSRILGISIASVSDNGKNMATVNLYQMSGVGRRSSGNWCSTVELQTLQLVNRKQPLVLVHYSGVQDGSMGHYTAFPSAAVLRNGPRAQKAARATLERRIRDLDLHTMADMERCVLHGLNKQGHSSARLQSLFELIGTLDGQALKRST